MSLDVYLNMDTPTKTPKGSGIFLRENGQTREVTQQEWDERFPGTTPVVLTDIDGGTNLVYSSNITHNLGQMASAAGIYEYLWRPDEIGVTTASQLIEPLAKGLHRLRTDPEHYKTFDSPNGWGVYENLVKFVDEYQKACVEYPDATVSVWR